MIEPAIMEKKMPVVKEIKHPLINGRKRLKYIQMKMLQKQFPFAGIKIEGLRHTQR